VVQIRLLGDARRSIATALAQSVDIFGEQAATRYAALIRQAISDFATDPTGPAVRRLGTRRPLLRYDLISSRRNVETAIGRVVHPRHFLVGRLEDDVPRILFLADDRMKPENLPRRSRGSDRNEA
jgi:hypothetical protein